MARRAERRVVRGVGAAPCERGRAAARRDPHRRARRPGSVTPRPSPRGTRPCACVRGSVRRPRAEHVAPRGLCGARVVLASRCGVLDPARIASDRDAGCVRPYGQVLVRIVGSEEPCLPRRTRHHGGDGLHAARPARRRPVRVRARSVRAERPLGHDPDRCHDHRWGGLVAYGPGRARAALRGPHCSGEGHSRPLVPRSAHRTAADAHRHRCVDVHRRPDAAGARRRYRRPGGRRFLVPAGVAVPVRCDGASPRRPRECRSGAATPRGGGCTGDRGQHGPRRPARLDDG
jgi:hypothetical protein